RRSTNLRETPARYVSRSTSGEYKKRRPSRSVPITALAARRDKSVLTVCSVHPLASLIRSATSVAVKGASCQRTSMISCSASLIRSTISNFSPKQPDRLLTTCVVSFAEKVNMSICLCDCGVGKLYNFNRVNSNLPIEPHEIYEV